MRTARPPRRSLKPRRSPVQDRSQATVDAILEAAARVFQREGYAEAFKHGAPLAPLAPSRATAMTESTPAEHAPTV